MAAMRCYCSPTTAILVWALVALAGEIAAPVSVVYKPPHLAAMGNLLVTIAERFGVTPVPVKELRKHLLRGRQKRQVWTLVADQRPGRDGRIAQLCGRDTPVFHRSRADGAGAQVACLLLVLRADGASALPLSNREDRGTALRQGHRRCGALRRKRPGRHQPGTG